MITQPSIARLLESMRDELTEKILPALDDATLKVNVQMMTAVLNALVVRVDNELTWMRDEAATIEATAEQMLPALDDPASVVDALDAYRSGQSSSLRLSEAQADYDRAGEVLARLTEAAYASGEPALIGPIEALFDQRLATEHAAVGTFIAVGRD